VEKKIPTVSTLRRWKRDALEQSFGYEGSGNSTFRKDMLMLKNFAKVCSILIDKYPTLQQFNKMKEENNRLLTQHNVDKSELQRLRSIVEKI
jgi:hypothetical protein